MIRIRTGKVSRIISKRPGYTQVEVEVEGSMAPAINFPELTGEAEVGDEVIVNTSALHLKLGTGGNHFIMGVVGKSKDLSGDGHIMKMRYTPVQGVVFTIEEEKSPYHELFNEGNLMGTPVIAASLHSALLPAVITLKHRNPRCRVVYVMTDGGALPAKISHMVAYMKSHGLIDSVITCGHAFGGDYEAITLYSGLLAAKVVCNAEVIICCMGPGVVGSSTTWGTTALEQGVILDAANILQGVAIAALRISFSDPRKRHCGISHHSLTALGKIATKRCILALPLLPHKERVFIEEQLKKSDILSRHQIKVYDTQFVLELLKKIDFKLTTMGRSVEEDPWPFLSASAASLCALEHISKE